MVRGLDVVINGSLQRFAELIDRRIEEFRDLGVNVRSPRSGRVISAIEGFVSVEGDVLRIDHIAESAYYDAMRVVENGHVKEIPQASFVYLVIPDGRLGASAAFETGFAVAHGVPVYADKEWVQKSREPIVRAYVEPIMDVAWLVKNFNPKRVVRMDPIIGRKIMYAAAHQMKEENELNATIATGTIPVYAGGKRRNKQEILIVKTHKWQGRWSIIGECNDLGEKCEQTAARAAKEQANLAGVAGKMICAFHKIPSSGYFRGEQDRFYVDHPLKVDSKEVVLDARAQEYAWVPPKIALRDFDLEPNARKTIETYAGVQ